MADVQRNPKQLEMQQSTAGKFEDRLQMKTILRVVKHTFQLRSRLDIVDWEDLFMSLDITSH